MWQQSRMVPLASRSHGLLPLHWEIPLDYTGGCISDSVSVSGEFSNNHTITGLENGQIYTISIVSTSSEDIRPPVSGIFVPLGK